MHWINRGPEPDGVAAARERYTQGWINYHGGKANFSRPSDSHWSDFHEDLRKVFNGLCVYCEERDKGEVDHFRPSSKFPTLIYQWSNWMFACHWCNHTKRDKWPEFGYVDPCCNDDGEKPEAYFTFDTISGEIIPKQELSDTQWAKAQQMIDDLGLNNLYHLENRIAWLLQVADRVNNPRRRSSSVQKLTHLNAEFSSITKQLLAELGYYPIK